MRAGAVILGMGRSGTSMVTAMFVAAGYYAGEADELLDANEANPAGYYENARVFSENAALLESLGRSWFDPPVEQQFDDLDPERVSALAGLLQELRDHADGRPLALKDPRIGVMLPVWWPLIEGTLEPVLVVRDPVEIALSLERRDDTPLPFSLASWEVHMTGLLSRLADRPVTVAPHRLLLAEPELAVELVRETTAQLTPALRARIDPSAAPSVIDRSLHRNRASSVVRDQLMTVSQLALWDRLLSLPIGRQTLERGSFEHSLEIPRTTAAFESQRTRLIRERFDSNTSRAEMGIRLHEQDRELHAARTELHELRTEAHELRVALHEARTELHQARTELYEARTRNDGQMARTDREAMPLRAQLDVVLRSTLRRAAAAARGALRWRRARG